MLIEQESCWDWSSCVSALVHRSHTVAKCGTAIFVHCVGPGVVSFEHYPSLQYVVVFGQVVFGSVAR